MVKIRLVIMSLMAITPRIVYGNSRIVEAGDWVDLALWDINGSTAANSLSQIVNSNDMSLPRAGDRYIGRALQFEVGARPVTDSAQCTNECLALEDTFCRYANDPSQGRCCPANELSCLTDDDHGICSNFYTLKGYKVFTCPFEEQACGPKSDWTLGTPEELMAIQSRAYFKKDKVCYYSISTPPTANPGDYLYLQMVSLVNTEAFITITKSMTETAPVYCAI